MPKRHYQISGTDSVDPYSLMLEGTSAVPDTLAHFISVRNNGTGTVTVNPFSGSVILSDLSILLATLGSLVMPSGQWDLNVPAGVRFELKALLGAPCSDVYVIMTPSG